MADITILVVDDDTELRRLLGDYLRKTSYQMVLAADGKTMRKSLEGGKIDLIVLDLMLQSEDDLV